MAPVTGSIDRVMTAGKGASGVAAQPTRKRLILGALHRCTPKGLAKIGEVRKSRGCHTPEIFPGLGRYADPPFPGGFLLMGSGCLGLAEIGTARAGLRAHSERAGLSSVHQPDRP